MSGDEQNKRSQTQMTLGEVILTFKNMDKNALMYGLSDPHSYRGYYCDLAVENYTCGQKTVEDTLGMFEDCLGAKFEGYKGGDFIMTKNTPVWVAVYGCCGQKLMKILKDGEIETQKDEY